MSEQNPFELARPDLGRAIDKRLTQNLIDSTPELRGYPAFDPERDRDFWDDLNAVVGSLRALVAYADPEMAAEMQALLDEIATLRADDRTAAELLASAGVHRYASAAERDADLPHRADGDWAWTISSSGATYHRREDGAWVERGQTGAGEGGTGTVYHDGTLTGNGTPEQPLGVVAGGGPRLTRTATGGEAARSLLASDDFSASTLSATRWFLRSGAITTVSGRAQGDGSGENIATVTAPLETSGVVQARVYGPAVNLYCRYYTNQNRVALGRYNGLTLSKLVSGQSTIIGNWPGVVWDAVNGNVLRLEYTPTTLKVFMDGVPLGTIEEVDLGNAAGAGFYVSPESAVDDFAVYGPAGGTISNLPQSFAVRSGGQEVLGAAVPPGEFAVYDADEVLVAGGYMHPGDTFNFTP